MIMMIEVARGMSGGQAAALDAERGLLDICIGVKAKSANQIESHVDLLGAIWRESRACSCSQF